MYHAGITAHELIETIKEEADIGIVIPDGSWYRWINTVEQFLYSEIIEEIVSGTVSASVVTDGKLPLTAIEAVDGADGCIFDDIERVYADDVELERASASALRVFTDKPMYGTDYNGNVLVHPAHEPEGYTIFRRLRPAVKSAEEEAEIALPAEHLELLASRMRAEAYKLANEDGLAAKWAADYNNYVENFRIWAMERNSRYGRG